MDVAYCTLRGGMVIRGVTLVHCRGLNWLLV